MHEYSPADLQRLFRLPLSLLRSLSSAGYTIPMPAEGSTSYRFQDLLILRTASALHAARIPAKKIIAALGNIRKSLPPGALLTTLALSAAGKEVVVRERDNSWEVRSGQYALPLQGKRSASVHNLGHRPPAAAQHELAAAHYARGHALEESDVSAARSAYLDALTAHSGHLEARVNLGRLLHLNGELKAAEKLYREATISSALLSFNLANLLEDMNRDEEAIAAYRQALAQDPGLYDAHFNLSRLLEKAQDPRKALQHLLAYRRFTRHLAD
jgi:tetratricopeptide (TPR) repeat protein